MQCHKAVITGSRLAVDSSGDLTVDVSVLHAGRTTSVRMCTLPSAPKWPHARDFVHAIHAIPGRFGVGTFDELAGAPCWVSCSFDGEVVRVLSEPPPKVATYTLSPSDRLTICSLIESSRPQSPVKRTAARPYGTKIRHNGKALTISGWAAALGVRDSNLRARLKRMPVAQALREPVAEVESVVTCYETCYEDAPRATSPQRRKPVTAESARASRTRFAWKNLIAWHRRDVCARWRHFANFLKDMGEKPAGRCLRLIDPNGRYGPGNCVWGAMPPSGGKTKRRMLTHKGVTRDVTQWCERLGVCRATLNKRLRRYSVEEALSMPKTQPGRHHS